MRTTIINGVSVTFQRRRYGRQFYCWAKVLNGSEVLECGDPWPAATWPRKALEEAISYTIAGKVLAPPAICGECGIFVYHSEACSLWKAAVA